MTGSYSYSTTFSTAHARKLAARVTTDLYQCSATYGRPSETEVGQYGTELEVLLAGGYVNKYKFGFQRAGRVVWALRYTVGVDGSLVADSRAGGIPRGEDVTGATYFNLLWTSASWKALTGTPRMTIEARLPWLRVTTTNPDESGGSWISDRGYAAGGVLVSREVYRRTGL